MLQMSLLSVCHIQIVTYKKKNRLRQSLGKYLGISELLVLGSLSLPRSEDSDFSSCKSHCKYRVIEKLIKSFWGLP